MRILRSSNAMTEQKGIVCEVADVYAVYSVQKVNGDPGRVNLQCHSDQTCIFLNPAICDKTWKERYFFVSKHWREEEDEDIPFW